MISLPTLDPLTDAQGVRVKDAYAPGLTNQEFVVIFKQWLREAVLKKVLEAESQALRQTLRADEADLQIQVEGVIPPPT